RCDEIAARNGMQLIIARKVDPAESAAAEALRHGRRLTDSQAATTRIIDENITRLQELIAVLEKQGIAVSVILPPIFIDYRQNLGVDEIVEHTKKKMQVVDLTRTFDDRPQLFRDATHIEWPEGTVLATEAALSQIRP
ncbi:MAG: hypothetical protein O3B72_08060, partial [Proteobacteria bacterium]|nr:hypothetical protein [Pseudomonadota bacterium]